MSFWDRINIFARAGGGDQNQSASSLPRGQVDPAPPPELPSPKSDEDRTAEVDSSIISVERTAFGLVGTPMARQNLDSLINKKGMKIYADMRLDEQVKAVCTFKRDAILSRGWCFEYDKESKLAETEQKQRIRIFEKIIEKMPGSFIDALNVISVGREFGYSLTEKVYQLVRIDGKDWVGLESLRGREPISFEFKTDPFGSLISCQQIAGGVRIDIDLDKFIHYVHNPEFDIYLGRSDLREAYRAWYFKDRMMNFWALYQEKMGGGALIITQGPQSTIGGVNAEAYKNLKLIAENFKSSSGMVLPKDVAATLVFPTSTDSYEKAVTWLDLAIARALLVPNLLGVSHTGQTGAYAQSQTQLEAFAWTLKADATRLESCLNEQLFYDLGEQNWGDGEYPCFKFKPNTTEQTKWVLTSLSDLISKGAIVPTEDDEKKLREILELPPRSEDSKPLMSPTAVADKEHELGVMDKQHQLGEEAKDAQVKRGIAEDKKRATDPVLSKAQKEEVAKYVVDEQRKFQDNLIKQFGFRPEGETTSIRDYGFKVRVDALDKYNVTEEDWGKGQLRDVPVDVLIATQKNVNKENLGNVNRDKPIVVVQDSGQYYIFDGHHRAVMAKEDGEETIRARVLDGTEYRVKKFAYNPNQERDKDGTWTSDGTTPSMQDHLERELDGAVHGAQKLPSEVADEIHAAVGSKKMPKSISPRAQNALRAVLNGLKSNTSDERLKGKDRSEAGRLLKWLDKMGTKNMAVSARDARLNIASARERVDFAVIDHKQRLYGEQLAGKMSKIVAGAVNNILGNDEQLKQLTDTDTADIANVDVSGMDRGRLKSACKQGLADAWSTGRIMADEEIRRVHPQRKVKHAAHFASLKDKSIEYFENNGFRMAGNVSDGVRGVLQQELQNAVKAGKTPQQTRETIWDRLTSKGFVTRDDVREAEQDKGVITALNELWLDDEAQAAHYLDTLARTNLFESMNEARYGEFTDPALDGFVVAFRYSAVLDDRTTDICSELDGHVHEADSEIWDDYRPPNHYNCRSILTPITQIDVDNGDWDGEISDPPTVEPQEGFK